MWIKIKSQIIVDTDISEFIADFNSSFTFIYFADSNDLDKMNTDKSFYWFMESWL